MVKLRSFEKNLPDECRDNLLSMRSLTLPGIIEGLSDPNENSLIIWLPSVHRFLDIYKPSKKELARLISLLYHRIFNSDTSLDGLCVTLRLLNRCLSLKSKVTLSVNWRDLYDFYQALVKTSESFLISKKQITGVFEEISKCIKRSRKFFTAEAATEILDHFIPKICPGGDNTEVVMWICNLIPNKGQGSCDWVEQVVNLLMVDHRNLNWVINILSCLSSAAQWYPNYNWNHILPRLYNEVLPSLPLMNKSLPRPKTYFFEPSPTANLNTQYMKKSSSFAKIIAFTLDLSNIQYLEQWLRNMQSMIKEGKLLGSGFINYISRIVSSYCKRIQKSSDHKLDPPASSLTDRLVNLVLPLVRLIFYSNQLSQIDRLCSQLCFLNPSLAIPQLLAYSIELLQDYEIPHQSVIQALTGILRPVLEPSIFGKNDDLNVLLNLTLVEINPSDMQKTCKILALYGQLSCYLTIENSVWANDFFSNLLATLAELETSNDTEVSRGLKIEEFLEVSFNVLCDNVSQDIFEFWVQEFVEFVMRNNCLNAVTEFGILAKFLVRRDPERLLPKLVKLSSGILSSSKNQILWRIGILTEALSYCGGIWTSVIPIIDEISADYPEESGKLISSLLSGGLDVYPKDYSRLLPSNRSHPGFEGRFCNQSKTLDLQINWYIPTSESITSSNSLLDKYLLHPPSSKADLKNYLKIAVQVVKTWSSFINIKNDTLGFVHLPRVSIYNNLIDFEISMEKVINYINELGFLNEDPILMELFVDLLSNTIHNVDLTFAFVRMGNKQVNELRKNNFNPLISCKEKNLNETRPYLIKKTLNLYRKVVSSNYCQKTFEGVYSRFFNTLIALAQCQFKPVRAKAINSVKLILKSSFIGLKGIIRQTWLAVTDGLDLNDSEKLKMQMEVLVDHEAIWRKNIIGSDLSIFEILNKTQQFSDIEVQTQIFNYFCNFVMSFYPNCRLVNKKFEISENLESTQKLLSSILQNSSSHWRTQLYLLILLLIYKNSFSVNQIEEVYKYLGRLVIDENYDIRETAQSVLAAYLYMDSKSCIKKEKLKFVPQEFEQNLRYLAKGVIDRPTPVYFGWSSKEFEYNVRVRDSDVKTCLEGSFLFKLFNDTEKVEKFFEYLAVGHMLKSEEGIVSNPRTRMNDNVNSSIRFLNNPHKFIEAFYINPRGYHSDFSEKTAKLIRYFGTIYGESSCQLLFETCEKFLLKDKHYQCAALEVLAGLGSASRVWSSSTRFLQTLSFAFRHSAMNSIQNWNSMLGYSLKKLSLSIQLTVYNTLLDQMTLFSNKKLSKILKLLATLTSILAWRGGGAYIKFFETLKSLPHDIFADLRTSVSRVISKIVVHTSYIDSKASLSWPSLQISYSSYLIYQSDLFTYLTFLSSTDTSYSNHLLLEIIQQLYNEAVLDYSVFPLLVFALPELQNLLRHSDIKIVSKASEVLKLVSALRATELLFAQVLALVSPGFDSKVQEMIKGLVLTMMWFYNQFLVSAPASYFHSLVLKGNIEVKLAAKFYLSIIWRVLDEETKLKEFEEIEKAANDASTCFRLAALVLGQKEFIEKWKGKALVRLARMKKLGGEAGACVNSTFAEFWKCHKTWWTCFMKYSEEFSEGELQEIESFNADHSYFS